MLCREIVNKIEEVYPKKYAMDWDNVGLLAGRGNKEVSKIYVALDLTEEALAEAVRWKADMIVTHHPLIFSPLKTITDESVTGNYIITMLKNDISYYAMHTNYDVLRMAELSAEIFGFAERETLDVFFEEEKRGLGCIGTYGKELNLRECCEIVKKQFGLEHIKVFGDLDKKIERIAICPGSGKSVIRTAVKKGADVLITGDIGHHEGIDAAADGMAVIDAGHYGLEYIYIEDMRKFLEKNLLYVEIKTAGLKPPFQFI